MDTFQNSYAFNGMVAAAVISLTPGSSAPFAARMFGGLVESELRKNALVDLVDFSGAGFSGLCFVAWAGRVKEVKSALQCLRRTIQNNRGIACFPYELAFFDSDEGFWRTVYPSPAFAPFDRFLTPEILLAFDAKCQEETDFLRNVIGHSQALLRKPGNDARP